MVSMDFSSSSSSTSERDESESEWGRGDLDGELSFSFPPLALSPESDEESEPFSPMTAATMGAVPGVTTMLGKISFMVMSLIFSGVTCLCFGSATEASRDSDVLLAPSSPSPLVPKGVSALAEAGLIST